MVLASCLNRMGNAMRDKLIKLFDVFVWILMGLGVLISIGSGIGLMFNPWGVTVASLFSGFMIMVAGTLGSLIGAGAAFIAVGIYNNTKIMAERR